MLFSSAAETRTAHIRPKTRAVPIIAPQRDLRLYTAIYFYAKTANAFLTYSIKAQVKNTLKKPKTKLKASTVKTVILDYSIILLGSLIYAFAVDYFIVPNNISAGGVTGISTLVNYGTGFPIGVASIIINIPLIIAAFKCFGIGMLIRTAFATFFTSIFIDILNLFITPYQNENTLLAAIFGGAIGGIGLGLAICRAVIEAHGGEIYAENRKEGGARFVFWLNAEQVNTDGR